MSAITIAENGLAPDVLVRFGIRRLLEKRLTMERLRKPDWQDVFREDLMNGPLAESTDKANEQHYELPTEFFKLMLGEHMKYSCCYWSDDVKSLSAAEQASLELVAERAQLEDKQHVLELGCGWGAFSLWAAQKFPSSRFTAVSNSASQKQYILKEADRRGLRNLVVITADMNEFVTDNNRYDRVVSLEMFEHMRNYQLLLERISNWLVKDGKLFVHVFSHKEYAYPFEDEGEEDDWMARYFFTGGIMPSHKLLPSFNDHLHCEEDWTINGCHYQRTLDSWLWKLDANRESAMPILGATYGYDDAEKWLYRWRIFLMACSELFGYDGGNEWQVSHYRFGK